MSKQPPGIRTAGTPMHAEAALPPPVDHRGCAGVRESRGLPVSCVHGGGGALYGEDALTEALVQRICAHYAAAFKLLPVAEHPEFITCLDSGGAPCLGLLEPRSNIVANAVINLRRYLKQRNCRRNAAAVVEDGDGDDDPTRWLVPARRSLGALVYYLNHYFRYLSPAQALAYLYLADADLVAAMGLVETDLAGGGGRSHFTFHAPSVWRVGGALDVAAEQTDHPDVSFLVYKSFDAAMAGRFQPVLGKHPIDAASLQDAADFVNGVWDDDDDDRSGRHRRKKAERPPLISVYGLRRRKYGADRITPLPPPLAGVRMPRPSEGEEAPCAYEETLRKMLLDAIHICYLQAFARLAGPAAAAAMHIPIIRSGLCFGPLDDPVDNILVNAVWFKTAFPSQSPAAAAAAAAAAQLVYNARLAVLCARSLDASIAYLCTRFPDLSRHDATLLLYRSGGCDVTRAGELAELAGHAPSGDSRAVAIRAAIRAAEHPEEARMANFVHVLSDEAKERVLARLRRPRPGPLLGVGDLDEIAMAFDLDFYFPLDDGLLREEKPEELVLSARARTELENRTYYRESKQRRIMRKLDAILDEETEVLCVFGTRWFVSEDEAFYHVNFLARNVKEAHWDLFFAQIWDTSRTRHDDGRFKSVYFPLGWSAKLGTCMSRIEAPDLLEVAMCAGTSLHVLRVEHGDQGFHPNYGVRYNGIDAAVVHQECADDDDYIDSDCVYFNDQKDIRLVERLNGKYS
ncbi:unnamed protein product [Urochloa decumbens]|uniref:Uncharacterized protein n=1 Tax=Urochloa decumbens TaxID=240449 RepID=A0ABC8VKU6_9POAL